MDAAFTELHNWLGDRLSAILALIGIVASAAWIVYVFLAKSTRDPAQKYYDLKLSLSTEAANSVARIATSNNAETVRAAAIRFEELYWGELVLIEDNDLEFAMVQFRKLIASSNELEIEKLASWQIDRAELRVAALKVSRAAFNLLQPNWLDQVKAFFRKPQKG